MSISPGTITRLTGPQLDCAVQILTSAFLEDPLMAYLFPEPGKRRENLAIFFKANLEYAMAAGEIYINSSQNGVAAWLFQGDKGGPKPGSKEDPRSQLGVLLDSETAARLAGFTRAMAALHKDVAPEKRRYLLFLGVKSGEQGKGIGTAMIKPGLQIADDSGLPCMLDTMNERDLKFYRRQRFEIRRDERICGDGPRTWTMFRPRPALCNQGGHDGK
jgi:ribosomal protein S18 acetylase RimI-like enzyme